MNALTDTDSSDSDVDEHGGSDIGPLGGFSDIEDHVSAEESDESSTSDIDGTPQSMTRDTVFGVPTRTNGHQPEQGRTHSCGRYRICFSRTYEDKKRRKRVWRTFTPGMRTLFFPTVTTHS